ncbi:MAG: DEAD/DEAH box helicase family protein [Oscillospiraceae bacterium]|jgi:predicted helicase|nr:DEAD/DEAH box helicase family protein [Oscillospiraceae bacterium]
MDKQTLVTPHIQFNDILSKYRAEAASEREKGTRFERLMRSYMLTDPKYTSKLRQVWLWNEFPARSELGDADTGIDLVAETYTGEFWAVQCKFYDAATTIDKADVDTFISTSGRNFHFGGKMAAFSLRVWISTTDRWTNHAEESLKNQTPEVTRINIHDLADAPVDWELLENGIHGEAARTAKYELLEHQREAVDAVHEYFQRRQRGKLIMACGTGKTFTSLRIAEQEAACGKLVLFCVPSIALLGQTLREWTANASGDLNTICVCSDPKVTQKSQNNMDAGGISTVDLTVPATTYWRRILDYHNACERDKLTVIFTTYQSIDAIAKAQASGLPEFDIVICDEAHRTTGVTLKGEQAAVFVKIHDDNLVKGKLRLYMTATPKLYTEESKAKAAQGYATLCSMDDEEIYGAEIYRIGFGEAVEKGLLSDYKVLIFTVSENDVPAAVQEALAKHSELNVEDTAKLIGCINALSKQILGDTTIAGADPQPMCKAVAFCQSIANSKQITAVLNAMSQKYIESLPEQRRDKIVNVVCDHIDGTMTAPTREQKMSWLKSNGGAGTCKILSNVRCLSEGVDVPALDAVLFLAAKNSQVDVVQSVGRVMRRAEGKRYGYIVIPIVVPAHIEPEIALNDNERYKVVWSVLNALRAHDERFNAVVNKIELNKKKPDNIVVGGIDRGSTDEAGAYGTRRGIESTQTDLFSGLEKFTQLQSAIYARLVRKVGTRQYWEQWAQSVAEIAQRQIERIAALADREECRDFFDDFVGGLQNSINRDIDRAAAIEMLAQHWITAPVFNALFSGYEFAGSNAISGDMNAMLSILSEYEALEDIRELQNFYDGVRKRAEGIDNSEGKQRVIIELYNTFFKTAFPKMAERLGIVYTPLEVVDFIIQSVDDVLKAEFGCDLAAENVNILDPFTGTGIFITRLLQSGLIAPSDLDRKYKTEIFANEIVLLAYYIAAVNIENAYHDITRSDNYQSFDGICLTDTFQLAEEPQGVEGFFPANSARLERQKNAPITVIIGNPPYSVNGNTAYSQLDASIRASYSDLADSVLKGALYDSYIRAFRWATNRLGGGDGIIGFVSNGGWLDGSSTAGFRKSLVREFSKIYVFNLRGNQRTSGELSRREGGKIFGSGSRAPVAITLLVKRRGYEGAAEIYYRDIGDYLDRKAKLEKVKAARSFAAMELSRITPNAHGDWITERSDAFAAYIPLAPKRKFEQGESIFVANSNSLKTGNDYEMYNYSESEICERLGGNQAFSPDKVVTALYRPYSKTYLYCEYGMIQRPGQWRSYYPTKSADNMVIAVSGIAVTKNFSCLITNSFADYELVGKSQCFPLYYYEDNPEAAQMTMFEDGDPSERYVRKDGVSDWIAKRAREQYGAAVKKEDIFYYVYGYLHSPAYRAAFASDLKKSLPRIPLVERADDFWRFSRAGRELARLHLRYEEMEPLSSVEAVGSRADCRVTKMRFLAKDRKDTILYNKHIKVVNVPAKAYEYAINGRSAVEWVMERYQLRTDKNSGIVNDPNAYRGGEYVLDLLLRIIAVSVATVDIVAALPQTAE